MNMKENIAIWGTGRLAEKLYCLRNDSFNIVCFFDNDERKHNTKKFGVPILKWTKANKYKIIIASSYWREIAEQLSAEGLSIDENYEIYSKYMETDIVNYSEIYYLTDKILKISAKKYLLPPKKIAVVYGNCQTILIENAIRLHCDFSNEYMVIRIPKVYEYIDNKGMVEYFIQDEIFWSQVDLFIYQTVSANNRFSRILCTDVIKHKLRLDCKVVNIVNLFFDGYFPQRTENKNYFLRELHQAGLFPFGDIYVDAMVNKNFSIEQIISVISEEDFISKKEILKRIRESFNELKTREAMVDIKISDYIEKYYKEEQLFYSPNHPSWRVLSEYINRIVAFLGYEHEEISEADVALNIGTLKGVDIPIYPAVKKVIGLKKYEKKYYPNRFICEDLYLNFHDFMIKYLTYVGVKSPTIVP